MQRSDFDYKLPRELIAQHPLPQRCASRLLTLEAGSGAQADRQFSELPDLLNEGDLLVLNNTRVIPARLFGRKATGGRVEVLVERVVDAHHVLAHVRASKPPKPGGELLIDEKYRLRVTGRDGDLFQLEFIETSVEEVLEVAGHMPLPPYIQRADGEQDASRYQTVYAEQAGAVAAPTAGLHFEEAILDRITTKGVRLAWVTLHVGAGTFQPVRVDDIREHRMHKEWFSVSAETCQLVNETRQRGGRVVAVGTTSVRALESVARDGELEPYQGETDIFITPGFTFKIVDALLTNFHLPESTLLMLVAAFAGYETIMAAYRHAVQQRYRFFSYGDAMLIYTK